WCADGKRVTCRDGLDVIIAQVLEVEDIEYVDGHTDARACDSGEVFAQSDVDPPIGPAAKKEEVPLRRRKSTREVRGVHHPAEARRRADVDPGSAPECDQTAELDSGQLRDVHDPIRHDAMPL